MVAVSKSILGIDEGTNISVKIVKKLLLMSGNPMMISIPGIVCTTNDIFDSINSPLVLVNPTIPLISSSDVTIVF